MKKISALVSATILGCSLLSAHAETLDESVDRFGEFFSECSLSFAEGQEMSAAEKLAMETMMDSMLDSLVDEMKTELTEKNVDPADVSACITNMESIGCSVLELDEPPAGCEALDEAMD